MSPNTGHEAGRSGHDSPPGSPDAVETAALREFAGRVASEAGKFAALGRDSALSGAMAIGSKSAPNDLVTSMDRACEQLLRERVERAYPNDGFLGEESAPNTASDGPGPARTWIVDPIDGTVNYVRNIPAWCVSVAVWDQRGPLAAAVYVPPLDRLYTAGRGLGATCNGEPISVSTPSSVHRLILATGFSYDANRRREQHAVLGSIIGDIADIRRSGSAAFDLCQVASGLVDLYYESSLSKWDLAAGVLIADEGGARSQFGLRDENSTGAGSYGIASGTPFAWDLLRAHRWNPVGAAGIEPSESSESAPPAPLPG